jgi:PAS domain S-box-containing protein
MNYSAFMANNEIVEPAAIQAPHPVPTDDERRLSAILEIAFDGLLELNSKGLITAWNPGAEAMFGWAPGEVAGKHAELIVSPRHREAFLSRLTGTVENGAQFAFNEPLPMRALHRDGRTFSTDLFLCPRTSGADYSISVFVRNLTSQEQLRNLLEERANNRSILNFIEDGYTELDLQGNHQWVNDAFCRIFNRKREEVLDPSYQKITHRPVSVNIRELYKKVYQSGEPVRAFEYEYVPGRFCETTVSLKRGENGQPTGFVTLIRETTSRNQHERELAMAKEAADGANRAKSAFLANMSHEIRTPMNAIIGMTSLLLDRDLDAESVDYVETIRSASDSLLTIINDVLDFSKIESGKLEFENQPLDLVKCAEDAVDLLSRRAAEKGLELVVDVHPSVPRWIFGDVTRLRQILVNLVSNSVKFTATGEVVLTVQPFSDGTETQHIHFAVHDTGCGIPADRLERLFQSFSQVDASTTRNYGGTGLGLAISKRLTELMGGTIWVQSEIGMGSVFQFTIPRNVAPQQEGVPETGTNWSGKRILVVDDNATNRRILTTQLLKWELQPASAATPHEAIELLRQERFDLALIDFEMPDMNGVELARRLKDLGFVSGTRMILSSSSGISQREMLGDVENNPFDAFLTKPTRSDQLKEVLGRLLGGAPAAPVRRSSSAIDTTLAAQRPLHILLAEDNVVNQKVAVRLLERMGYRPDVASNGLEALAAVHRQHYDVVLMDVQMPEMDGLEASRRITSELDPSRRPRLVALTANVFKGDQKMCLEAGMDDYLAKPLDLVRLQDALLRCVSQRSPWELASTPLASTDLGS